MLGFTLQEKKPVSLRSSENFVFHYCSLEYRTYKALCIIRVAACFSSNSGPAMIYTFSNFSASRYKFPMPVVHISHLFNSARNNMILSPRSETNSEYTLLIDMSVK